MGKTLLKIYDVITDKTGFTGRMKLAEMTKVSKDKAAELEDNEELLAKFKKAASEILGKNIDEFLR